MLLVIMIFYIFFLLIYFLIYIYIWSIYLNWICIYYINLKGQKGLQFNHKIL